MVEERSNFGLSTPIWDQVIHQSSVLTGQKARAPERNLANYLEDTFEKHGISYRIRYGFDPISVESEDSGCPTSTSMPVDRRLRGPRVRQPGGQADWPIIGGPTLGSCTACEGPTARQTSTAYSEYLPLLTGGTLTEAKDSNILLTNATSGGCGAVGGNVCTAPAGNVAFERGTIKESSEPWARNTLAQMHEIGHNMGYYHDIHPGWAENVGGFWKKTPTVANNGVTNLCGNFIETRTNQQVMRVLDFNDCATENISFAEGSEQIRDSNGGGDGGGDDGGTNGGGGGGGGDGGGGDVDGGGRLNAGLAGAGLLLFFLASRG